MKALLLLALLAGAAEPRIQDATLDTRPVTHGLAATLATLAGAARDAAWIGYSVPAVNDATMCCYESTAAAEKGGCGGCRLEGRGAFTVHGDAHPLEKSGRVNVLYRAEKGALTDVRAFSAECVLDAAGRPVHWLTGVEPADSVRHLQDLVATHARRDDEIAEHALAALASHAGIEASRALASFTERAQPREIRKKAAFWLGSSRGREGLETLRGLLRDDPDPEIREHAIFALHVSDTPDATDLIVATAKTDRDPGTRGKALFWLGQKAGKKAVDTIGAAIEDDPDEEVREKAVFALSQLPDGEGVPHLLRLAKSHRSPGVRRKALFWLGQSGDPRALALFEEVLAR